MRRLILIFGTVICWTTSLFAADAPTPVPAVTVAQIVARNAAARGGLEAWRAVKTMKMVGEMDAGHGVKLPYSLELKRSHKMRLELQFKGETALETFDGKEGWKLRPFLGRNSIEKMSSAELRAANGETELDGALIDYAAKGCRLELMGEERVEGKDAYKLKLIMPGNIERHIWVDSATMLEVKIDNTRRMDGKDRVMETYLRDYRDESGLLVPHLLETATQGVTGTQKLTVQAVLINPALDDSRFAKP